VKRPKGLKKTSVRQPTAKEIYGELADKFEAIARKIRDDGDIVESVDLIREIDRSHHYADGPRSEVLSTRTSLSVALTDGTVMHVTYTERGIGKI
jgi:hypothetical protein